MSICDTTAAANTSVTAPPSRVVANIVEPLIVPLELIFPLAVMWPVTFVGPVNKILWVRSLSLPICISSQVPSLAILRAVPLLNARPSPLIW